MKLSYEVIVMTENILDNSKNRVEYTRVGFSYLGKALDILLKEPHEAKIILALNQGDTTFSKIATLTAINDATMNRNLQLLINKKCITIYPLHKRNIYSLTETGKVLARAWTAFVKTLDLNFLPSEQLEMTKVIIENGNQIVVPSPLIRKRL